MYYNYYADMALLRDRKVRTPKFKLVHQSDSNCQMLTDATNRNDAAFDGLKQLGWSVVRYYED